MTVRTNSVDSDCVAIPWDASRLLARVVDLAIQPDGEKTNGEK